MTKSIPPILYLRNGYTARARCAFISSLENTEVKRVQLPIPN